VQRVLAPPHDVVTRTSAREALDALAADDGGWDVVLCDLMMPEMTGMDLHARLAADAPALAARFVFLTGGAFTERAREFLDRVPNPRLEKPFDPATLREVVARVLASARP
jgi:CheY-like chemotaxis protein